VPAVVGLVVLFWAQFAWVGSTNFDGHDEWLIHDLAAKGVISYPHSNRPYGALWSLPGYLLSPHSFRGHYAVHTAYLMLSGLAVYAMGRRWMPGQPIVAFLAGAFTMLWAPRDLARLNTVQMTMHSGAMMGTLVAVLLLVESWYRRRVSWLVLGGALAFVTVRSYEAVVPLLLCAPALLLMAAREGRGRMAAWILPWLAGAGAAVALVLWPILRPTQATAYQMGTLGIDRDPWAVAARLLQRYADHLLPLVTTPPHELLVTAVPLVLLVYAAVCVWITRRLPPGEEEPSAAALWPLAIGLAAAGLGYLPYALSPAIGTPMRTQFLPACGIGLALAAALALLARVVPRPRRTAAVLLLAAWPVAVGTARTVAMQKDWDRLSRFGPQRSLLAQLVARIPDVKPRTLVLLIDEWRAFPADFTFRHAVEYLYEGRARGYIPAAWHIFYPTTMDATGIHCEPWPILRGPWKAPTSLHSYEEVVVVRFTDTGKLRIERQWPETLPPLPEGAAYSPRSRILKDASPLPQHALVR
jgi:hypothetical protein